MHGRRGARRQGTGQANCGRRRACVSGPVRRVLPASVSLRAGASGRRPGGGEGRGAGDLPQGHRAPRHVSRRGFALRLVLPHLPQCSRGLLPGPSARRADRDDDRGGRRDPVRAGRPQRAGRHPARGPGGESRRAAAGASDAGSAATALRRRVGVEIHRRPVGAGDRGPIEAEPQGEVTIPANASTVSFPIEVINDLIHEETETVTISAEVPGFETKTDTFYILEHEPPVLTGPPARVEDSTPSFSWTAVPDATGYEILIADLNAGRATVLQSPVEGLEFTVPETLPNGEPLGLGNYIAWVRALENGDEGPWSDPVVFEVIVTPDILTPTGTISDLRPVFSWTPIPGAVSYELWVNHLDTTRNPALQVTGITGTTYTPTEDLLAGNYQFWILGVDADGVRGEFSEPGEFTLLARPTVIQPIGTTTDRTPTIAWSEVEDAAQYEVSVVDLTTGLAIDLVAGDNQLNATVTQATSFTPQANLPLSKFRVFVRSITAEGQASLWSVPQLFETVDPFATAAAQPVAGPLPQAAPDAEATVATAAAPLTWQPVATAQAYSIRIETLDGAVVSQTESAENRLPVTNLEADTYRAWITPIGGDDGISKTQVLTFVAEPADDLDSLFADPLAEW